MSVFSFIAKGTAGMIAGATVGAAMEKGKGLLSGIHRKETYEFQENARFDDKRKEYLTMKPLNDGNFLGRRNLLIQDPSVENPPTVDCLWVIELIRQDGARLYLFCEDDENLKLKQFLTEDVTMDPNFEDRCFYLPGDFNTVNGALAKLVPYLGCVPISLEDGDGDYFIGAPSAKGFGGRGDGFFMAGVNPGDLPKWEREFLMRTFDAWDENNMSQVLGSDTCEFWVKQMYEMIPFEARLNR